MVNSSRSGPKTTPKRRRYLSRRTERAILAGIISLVALAFGYPQAAQKLINSAGITPPGTWRVSQAVDGDTLLVAQNGRQETVRLIGVDTPETKDPRKPIQCFGYAAADHTRHLAEGKSVRLEADPNDSDRDKYKRLLRYVYLPDGTLLNAELIKDGYAFAYTVFSFTKIDEFRQLEKDARVNNRGLWSGCQIDETSLIKQTKAP